ncbi:MAG: DUF4363 family protein [Clostridia bacterium]
MSNKVKIMLVICFTAIIVILEIILGNCTDEFIDKTSKQLEDLKIALLEENGEETKKKSKELSNVWDESENKLCYFIEHDELEKISSKIAIISENSTNSEYKLALEDAIETRYLLEHVKDKLKLKMKNVF